MENNYIEEVVVEGVWPSASIRIQFHFVFNGINCRQKPSSVWTQRPTPPPTHLQYLFAEKKTGANFMFAFGRATAVIFNQRKVRRMICLFTYLGMAQVATVNVELDWLFNFLKFKFTNGRLKCKWYDIWFINAGGLIQLGNSMHKIGKASPFR